MVAGKFELEQSADQFMDPRRHANSVGLGERLKPRGQVEDFARNRVFTGIAATGGAADDRKAGCNTRPAKQCLPRRIVQLLDSIADLKCAMDRAFGSIFARLWPAEISKHTIAQIFCDCPAGLFDLSSDAYLVTFQYFAEDLRIEARRHVGGIDQIDEHHGNLTPLAGRDGLDGACGGTLVSPRQDRPPRPERNIQLTKVIICQQGQCGDIDLGIVKRRCVSIETHSRQPFRDARHVPHFLNAALGFALHHWREVTN
ncbi:MAG: hypothetical protein ABIU10_09815 [Sphingomicrobium sp.]